MVRPADWLRAWQLVGTPRRRDAVVLLLPVLLRAHTPCIAPTALDTDRRDIGGVRCRGFRAVETGGHDSLVVEHRLRDSRPRVLGDRRVAERAKRDRSHAATNRSGQRCVRRQRAGDRPADVASRSESLALRSSAGVVPADILLQYRRDLGVGDADVDARVVRWLSRNTLIILPLHFLFFSVIARVVVRGFGLDPAINDAFPWVDVTYTGIALLLCWPAAVVLRRWAPWVRGNATSQRIDDDLQQRFGLESR